MEFEDLILKRRSIRKFNGDEVTKNQLNKILEAGLLAPTAMNRKPCNFLIVSNKDTLKELSEVKEHGSKFLKDADKAIEVLKANGEDAYVIGEITKGEERVVIC